MVTSPQTQPHTQNCNFNYAVLHTSVCIKEQTCTMKSQNSCYKNSPTAASKANSTTELALLTSACMSTLTLCIACCDTQCS